MFTISVQAFKTRAKHVKIIDRTILLCGASVKIKEASSRRRKEKASEPFFH